VQNPKSTVRAPLAVAPSTFELAPPADLLFVYGTLRRGFGRHGLLGRLGARYAGMGTVQGELFHLGDFPGAQRSNSASARIVGELYRLPSPSRAFRTLDKVEGFCPRDPASSLFARETTEVVFTEGGRAVAWVYWLNRLPWPARVIPSGDYARD
jgi:gamma-glutamylcyclotransferase (GGCT)/AIG2-like uncharacterized protein YtfP